MTVALSILFAIVAFIAVAAIWNAVVANWGDIMELRRRMAMPEHGAEVVVTFLDNAGTLDAVSAVRRPRQLRVPAPKPVTHRLHHFARNRSVA